MRILSGEGKADTRGLKGDSQIPVHFTSTSTSSGPNSGIGRYGQVLVSLHLAMCSRNSPTSSNTVSLMPLSTKLGFVLVSVMLGMAGRRVTIIWATGRGLKTASNRCFGESQTALAHQISKEEGHTVEPKTRPDGSENRGRGQDPRWNAFRAAPLAARTTLLPSGNNG